MRPDDLLASVRVEAPKIVRFIRARHRRCQDRPEPRVDAGAADGGRPAPDQQRRRRRQLCDARIPASRCMPSMQKNSAATRSWCAATDGEKIVTLDGKRAHAQQPHAGDRRCDQAGRHRRHHGRREFRCGRRHHGSRARGALFQAAVDPLDVEAPRLSSDSSYRYERGVDPHMALEAAYRAIDLILEFAGGQVVGPAYKVGGDVPWQREIVVTHDYITEKLGFDIPAADMRAAFRSARAYHHPRGADALPRGAPPGPSAFRAGATISTAPSTSSRRCCGFTARRRFLRRSCRSPGLAGRR
jgi:hypothetical protein